MKGHNRFINFFKGNKRLVSLLAIFFFWIAPILEGREKGECFREMGRRRAGQRDGKKVGVVTEWEEGWPGRGMEGRRAGQRDGKKVGVVEGWEEGGRGRGM